MVVNFETTGECETRGWASIVAGVLLVVRTSGGRQCAGLGRICHCWPQFHLAARCFEEEEAVGVDGQAVRFFAEGVAMGAEDQGFAQRGVSG